MFVIKDREDTTFEWPVTVSYPRDGGKTQKFEFIGVFRRLSADEKDATPVGENLTGDEAIDQFIERAMQHMVGWRNVVDSAQKPVELSAAALRSAIRAPGGAAVIAGIARAIQEVESGEKRKN
jgi:hypothetical protein